MSRLTIWDLNYLLKFWIVLHFLQKPLAWSSKFYLHVQSKSCGRNSFLIFFSEFFRILSENFFRLLAKKLKKFSKLSSACPEEPFAPLFFFKSFEPLWIFCRNLWHGSQISIYVSRVKFAEEIIFFILPFWIFPDFERKVFQPFGQKTSRICQNYLLRVQRNNLWLEFFFKIWINSDFLQKPLAWFSKFYLRVQSKKCGQKSLFLLSFQIFFSNFERKFFRLLAKKLHEVFITIFYMYRGTVCGLKFFGMVLKILSTCPE